MWGSGFITQIIYASGVAAVAENFDLLTEIGAIITTEDDLPIQIEH